MKHNWLVRFCGLNLTLTLVGGFAQVRGNAATLWTGPNLTFTQSANNRSDTILAGKVVLTRGFNQVLYNTAANETHAGASSPADTEWAMGTLSNFASLQYKSLESMRNGNLAGVILNKSMVMHIKSADIYLSVKFTAWGQHLAGGFAYIRSTAPAGGVPPTVAITSPTNGFTLAAPANIALAADASVTGGTVTNVSFFNQSTLLGSVQTAPFSLVASNLAAGSYAITAVATAAGISSTSAVVNVTVVSPVAVTLSAPSIGNGLFSFSYSADPGLRYVVESSTDLLNWTPASTGVASSNPALFSEGFTTNTARFFRVGRLPNQ